ncbi:hypothetical protein PR048_025688 [Dryococelus australis]|uniref:Uncharacterized protein n=1 Tax=Dryococelus australis TaxID=614101 RepID=A0ABQ9GJ82_9NEOP|nr:hypothetical protein PR048_025688 [Dryococelus australis]
MQGDIAYWLGRRIQKAQSDLRCTIIHQDATEGNILVLVCSQPLVNRLVRVVEDVEHDVIGTRASKTFHVFDMPSRFLDFDAVGQERPEEFADSFWDKLEFKTCSFTQFQQLVHTVFDTSWRTMAQSSPPTVTADNQGADDIGILVHTYVESSLQVIELANSSEWRPHISPFCLLSGFSVLGTSSIPLSTDNVVSDVASTAEWQAVRPGGRQYGQAAGSTAGWQAVRPGGRQYGQAAGSTAGWQAVRPGGRQYGRVAGSTAGWQAVRPGSRQYGQAAGSTARWQAVRTGDWQYGQATGSTAEWLAVRPGGRQYGQATGSTAGWQAVRPGGRQYGQAAGSTAGWLAVRPGGRQYGQAAGSTAGWLAVRTGDWQYGQGAGSTAGWQAVRPGGRQYGQATGSTARRQAVRPSGWQYGQAAGSTAKRLAVRPGGRQYGRVAGSTAEWLAVRPGGRQYGQGAGSTARRLAVRPGGRQYGQATGSTARRQAVRPSGWQYGRVAGSTARRQAVRPGGRQYGRVAGSTARRLAVRPSGWQYGRVAGSTAGWQAVRSHDAHTNGAIRSGDTSGSFGAPSRTVGISRWFHTLSSIHATNTSLTIVPQPPVVAHTSFRSRSLARRPPSFTAGRWVAALRAHRSRKRVGRGGFPTTARSIRVGASYSTSLASYQGVPGSFPFWVTGFSHVGIVPDDAVGRRVFWGISRFPPPFHSGAAPYSLQSPSSPLRASLLRATQISSRTHNNIIHFTVRTCEWSGEIWAALNIEVLKDDEDEARRKLEIPEKTGRPAESSGTISTCENPGSDPVHLGGRRVV